MDLPLTVRVRASVTVGGGSSGCPSTTLYVLDVTVSRTSWTLQTRYSSLRALHLRLAPLLPAAAAPAFPARRLWRGNSPSTVARRRADLSAYLGAVCEVASARSPLLDALDARRASRYAFAGDLEALRSLSDADAARPDEAFGTPLHYAAAQGREACVLHLLERGARADARDLYGFTPGALAARRGHEAVRPHLPLACAAPPARRVPPQYETPPAQRRVFVLVNPAGGTGRARAVWERVVRPVLDAAGVAHEARLTEREGHAGELAGELDLERFDALACVSGDGLLHEAVNGLAARPDAAGALQLPLAVVPAGSANGLARAVGDLDALSASLRLSRGVFRPMDLLRVEQREAPPRVAFLMLAWGLVADIDFDSERNRWMGGARFTYEGVRRVLSRRRYAARLAYVPASGGAAADAAFSTCAAPCASCLAAAGEEEEAEAEAGAEEEADEAEQDPAQEVVVDTDDLSYFAATNVAWVGRDVHAAPHAHVADGCIDLVFARGATRPQVAALLLGLETGTHVESEAVEYVKARSFRLEPRCPDTQFDADGERMPNVPTSVTVLRRAASLLV